MTTENMIGPLPEYEDIAGMVCIGTDTYPCSVISRTEKRVVVSMNHYLATPDSEWYGVQKYTYYYNPDASTRVFTLRKNGQWVAEGADMAHGTRLLIGRRMAKFDPCF